MTAGGWWHGSIFCADVFCPTVSCCRVVVDWAVEAVVALESQDDAESGWNGGAGFKLAGGFKWDVAISSGDQRKVHVDIPT